MQCTRFTTTGHSAVHAALTNGICWTQRSVVVHSIACSMQRSLVCCDLLVL
jgi:hypothetical protein